MIEFHSKAMTIFLQIKAMIVDHDDGSADYDVIHSLSNGL